MGGESPKPESLPAAGGYPPPRPRSLWPVAFTVVALAVLGVASAAAWWVARGVSGVGAAAVNEAAEVVKAAVSPQVVRREVMRVILERPDRTPKLVVMTEPVRVIVERTDELKWLYVYWGTSSARLELAGNRVQWVVDLAALGDDSVTVDPDAKTVTVRVPPPRLDRDMVVVQTNPLYVREETERGWARLPASAQTLADDAKAQIVPAILAAADNADSHREARSAAADAVRALLEPLLSPYLTEQGLALRVVVEDAPSQPAPEGPG